MTGKNILKEPLIVIRRNSSQLLLYLVISTFFIGAYSMYMKGRNNPIDPSAFRPLLEVIARGESNGNYNAYFGNSSNTKVKFTSMSVDEVIAWQNSYVAEGSPSSAVGRYQIINNTLSGLVDQLGLAGSEKFDEDMQDTMATALLERRGARDYVNNRISREQFAANLAKEWAALPKVIGDNPEESHYASDGLNKSRVAVSEIIGAIKRVDI